MHHAPPPRKNPSALRRATSGFVLASFVATLPGAPAFAELVGEQVVHGDATFERDGKHTTITTHTRQTIVDYDRFDIDRDESVRIDQPTSRSRILNRVGLGDASHIDGSLSSNGVVYILNPAGVFLGDRAVVDVSGLVAAAGHLSNSDFLSGVDHVTGVEGEVGVAVGAVIRSARDVALIGSHVENHGTIVSRGGQIVLVAGEDVLLAPLDGNVMVRVDRGATEPPPGADPARFGVEQGGELSARRVVLSAGDGYSLAMNHTGVTRAEEIRVQAGPEGLAQIAGTLDASNAAAGEQGGRIAVRAGKIAVLDADLDASGAAGGGEISLGGGVRGSGWGQRAHRLFVSADATLRADALESGDGGRVVAYADERTGFYGTLSARGGAQGGDGGFAEISGAQLEARGDVDLGAPQGRAGTLLYDPEVIKISGGTGDGGDAGAPPTPDSVVDDDGTAGRVLFGSDGENGAFADEFEIFESEIEGTDANIVLEASNRIFASGSFDHLSDAEDAVGIVQLKPGRNLTLRTTGNSAQGLTDADLGIDLTTSAHGDALKWRVRDGGSIAIETHLDVLNPDDAGAPRASIHVGHLESLRAKFEDAPQNGFDVVLPATDGAGNVLTRSIALSAERGDIQVGDIQINGDDARAAVGSQPARSTSSAGNVSITSEQGDLQVGSISAIGGSGTAGETNGQGSLGFNGGSVTIRAGQGDVAVTGPIDVSGGRGRGMFLLDGEPAPFARAGGFGGTISINARSTDGTKGDLAVDGNLRARGGDGLATTEDGVVQDAVGNTGGTITLGADGNIRIGTAADPVELELDASGGSGTSFGGSASGGVSEAPDAIQIARGSASTAAGNFDVEIHARLIANGGASGVSFGTVNGVLVPPPSHEGAGTTVRVPVAGRGGDISVSSNGGTLHAADMKVDANGGAGFLVLDPVTGLPRTDEDGTSATIGGRGGEVNLDATKDVEVGTVRSLGGTGVNGSGDAGGGVTILTSEGNLTVDSVDTSGGDGTSTETGVVLRGGSAGSVVIGPDTGVGNVTIQGVVGGEGGTGQDADGAATVAQGASVRVNADVETGAIDTSGTGRLRGRNVTLIGFRIGADGTPVRVSGTAGSDDAANFQTFDELHADVRSDDGQVELANVVMKKAAAAAQVAADGTEIVHSTGATTGTLHTIDEIDTQAQDALAVTYRLDVTPATVDGVTEPIPDLQIARGAVKLGDAGGTIANGAAADSGTVASNRGAIVGEAAGAEAHATATGALRFEGRSVGSDATPIALGGAATSLLQFDVNGDVDAEVTGGDFGAVSVIQREALTGDTQVDLDGDGDDEIQVVGEGTNTSPISRIALADMTGTGSNFAYRLVTGANGATLAVDEVKLDGSGLLQNAGDIVLTDAAPVAITANGNPLTLDVTTIQGTPAEQRGVIRQEATGPEIAMGGTGTGSAALVFGARAFGSADAPIHTTALDAVAGTTTAGGIFLNNSAGADLKIQRVSNVIPEDLAAEPTTTSTTTGLDAQGGDVSVTHGGGRIVLGHLTEGTDAQGSAFHVRATGDVTLAGATAGAMPVEIENAHYEKTIVPVVGTVFVPRNDGVVISTQGDVRFGGDVDTSANSTVTKPGTSTDEFIHATLTVDAPQGVTSYEGDVGARDAQGVLARLDTSHAKFTTDDADGSQVNAGEAHFRGRVDGPASLTIRAADLPPLAGDAEDHTALAQFDGDIGQQSALGGLDVQAETIVFTGADRVTATGDIALSTQRTADASGVPDAATISDTGGGLRFQTQGNFTVGDRDKLSSAGGLAIEAGQTARFTDLSATQISVDANRIEIFKREPGHVKQSDGTTPMEFDTGTDLVANDIRLGAVPVTDGPGAEPVFGLGRGGIRAPGSLSQFQVVRFTPSANSVHSENLVGDDGEILDLTPTGSNVVGDPAEALPRETPTPESAIEVQPSEEGPPPRPLLTPEQLVAYLHCGDPAAPSPSCDASELAPLSSVSDWRASALSTARARELRERYGELRQTELSAAFAKAAEGYRAARGFGEFDAATFAHYLETSPDAAEARDAIHRFASLLVEIDLLGLSPDGVLRARRELAGELAAEADLAEFDADAVLEAVAATPIGMPPSR